VVARRVEMRKASVVLAGVVVGVLAFPVPAAAKVFAFQGGASSRDSPVRMTMTGKSLQRPSHVAGVSIGLDTVTGDCPGYSGPDPLTLPIHKGSGGPRGIPIRPYNGQLRFSWHYKAAGGPYEQLQGAQLGPHKWIGELSINWLPGHPPGGSYECYSNYQETFTAVFTG
jgi:hypothetical protein